jgi:riboflavin kinase / FMN adenylyltransferase
MSLFHSYHDLKEHRIDHESTIVGIGNFDGVHCGHQTLIERVVQSSNTTRRRPSILTFSPHPLRFFKGAQGPRQLYSVMDREDLLSHLGIQLILTQHFTNHFAQLSPHDFVKEVLIDSMHANQIIVGYDFAFGAKRSGRQKDLIEIAGQYGASVEIIEAQTSLDSSLSRPYSSTWIRELVSAGEIGSANKALGRSYHIRALVTQGLQRGRTLGFPTANLKLYSELCPGPGVYAAWLDWGQGPQKSVVSIGSNPTFEKVHRPSMEQEWSVEAHILHPEFSGDIDIYHQEITLWFTHRLRKMIRFATVEDLIAQIKNDCLDTRRVLKQCSQPSWPLRSLSE